MGVDTTGAADEEAGELLAQAIIDLMQETGVPNGLSAIGFTDGGHSGAGRGHFAPAPGNQTLAATGRGPRSGGTVPRCDEVLVIELL